MRCAGPGPGGWALGRAGSGSHWELGRAGDRPQRGVHCWARYALGTGQGCAGCEGAHTSWAWCWTHVAPGRPRGQGVTTGRDRAPVALGRGTDGGPASWAHGARVRWVRGRGGVRASGHTPPPPSVAQESPAPATVYKRVEMGRLGGHGCGLDRSSN